MTARADGVPADKLCASCGRRFAWRRKWASNWDDVRYCSDACRRRKVTGADRELEALIRERARSGPVAIDEIGGEPARRAARRLAASGAVELVQDGRAVDAAGVRGPFEVRLSRSSR